METIKRFFGAVLLGVAIWLISPVIPAIASMLLWAALLIVSAIYLHALDPLPINTSGLRKFWKGVGVILILIGVAVLIGALSGNRDVLQPLAGFRVAKARPAESEFNFERVANLTQFEQRLEAVKGKPVMLDFYAEWCVSCKEMERFTFSDPRVQAKLQDVVKFQVDVTNATNDDRRFLKRFNLFGPPGIIFFDQNGNEIVSMRTVGFQQADRFLKTLETRF
jgi:thiol:disulfide interchange protein DsbD